MEFLARLRLDPSQRTPCALLAVGAWILVGLGTLASAEISVPGDFCILGGGALLVLTAGPLIND